jgi:hypothetical protein
LIYIIKTIFYSNSHLKYYILNALLSFKALKVETYIIGSFLIKSANISLLLLAFISCYTLLYSPPYKLGLALLFKSRYTISISFFSTALKSALLKYILTSALLFKRSLAMDLLL